MRLPSQPPSYSRDFEQQRSKTLEFAVDDLTNKLSAISFGVGAPNFTPPQRMLYVRTDGGAGTTLYVYEGSAWAAK